MSQDQLIQKYQSLPRHLQQAADLYLEFLTQNSRMLESETPAELATQVRWAASPDPTAIFGLAAHAPLNLRDIRKKAWQR